MYVGKGDKLVFRYAEDYTDTDTEALVKTPGSTDREAVIVGTRTINTSEVKREEKMYFTNK